MNALTFFIYFTIEWLSFRTSRLDHVFISLAEIFIWRKKSKIHPTIRSRTTTALILFNLDSLFLIITVLLTCFLLKIRPLALYNYYEHTLMQIDLEIPGRKQFLLESAGVVLYFFLLKFFFYTALEWNSLPCPLLVLFLPLLALLRHLLSDLHFFNFSKGKMRFSLILLFSFLACICNLFLLLIVLFGSCLPPGSESNCAMNLLVFWVFCVCVCVYIHSENI